MNTRRYAILISFSVALVLLLAACGRDQATSTSAPVCTPPACGSGETVYCPGDCPGGCGSVCATVTPAFQIQCTPPACGPDETIYCPGDCPGGCGSVCATATPTAPGGSRGTTATDAPTPTPSSETQPGDDSQGGAEAGSSADAPTETSASTGAVRTDATTACREAQPTGRYYTVQPGDCLYRIGLAYNMSWKRIAAVNAIRSPHRIHAGQVLIIPGQLVATTPGATTPCRDTQPTGRYYTVQPGDCLYRIGLAYNMSWRPIAEANGIRSPYRIRGGQVLVIPGR